MTPKPITRIIWGLSLRCPDCGKDSMLAGWFKLKPACANCHLLFDRGQRDFFVGAYLINLIIAELVFGIGFGVWLYSSWPDIPWVTVQWVAVTAIILAPILTYPFTHTTWLATDLVFDPPAAEDRSQA